MTTEQPDDVGTSITITVPVDLPPEEVETIPAHERLGIVVGVVYGNTLADLAAVRAVAEDLEDALNAIRQAARDVLALDLVRHPTFAHDEDALKRLEDLANPAQAVDSSHEKEG